MFKDLVSYITHLSFFYTHTCHNFCIFFNFFADAANNFFSLVHGHFMYDFLRLLCCLNRIVHIFKYAMLFFCRSVCYLHFCHNLLYNFLYHTLTDWHETVLLLNYFIPN